MPQPSRVPPSSVGFMIAAACSIIARMSPASFVVEVDDQLADHHAVAEGDDASVGFEACVDDEARHETLVQRADVANRRPDVLRAGLDKDLLADGSHVRVLPGRA